MQIYKITNKINGKFYIGQTVDAKKRWVAHSNRKVKTAISAAIQKYGSNNFEFEIIQECPLEEANFWESHFIALYKSCGSGGYNLTTGGSARYKLAPESLEKIGAANRGKKRSLKTLEKMRVCSTGKKQSPETIEKRVKYVRGVKKSPEHVEKVRAWHIANAPCKGKTPTNARVIYGWDDQNKTGLIFNSLSEAVKYGYDISNISACCHGRLKRHKQIKWSFIEDFLNA